MTSATFTLRIASVSQSLFEGDATQLYCRGVAGDMTVLPHHEALLTKLEPCTLRITTSSQEHEIAISGGILEVADNKAVVLCSEHEPDISA